MEGGGTGLPYLKVMNSCCLAYGYKSRILVSLRMIMTKKHYFLAVKYLLERTQRNNEKKKCYFHLKAEFPPVWTTSGGSFY